MSTIYVYHEYNDSQAYGTQELKVFTDPAKGQEYLKSHVERDFKMPWDEIEVTLCSDDTFEPDYVSVDNGNGCCFYILEKQEIIS